MLVAHRLCLKLRMRSHTRCIIKPLKILRVEEGARLLSHNLDNALVNELSQILRSRLLVFAMSTVMRSDTLTITRFSDRLALESYLPVEILTSICYHSIRTSWLLTLQIHGLSNISVRITPWTLIVRVSSWLEWGCSSANLRRLRLLKILHLSDPSRLSVWNFRWVSRWGLTGHIFFVLILLLFKWDIMTLTRREQQLGSFFSIELFNLALDSSQVIVFGEDLKPQLFAALVQLTIVVIPKLKNAYGWLEQEVLVEILCRF